MAIKGNEIKGNELDGVPDPQGRPDAPAGGGSYRPRLVAERLLHAVQRFPVIVVCGARQVGKSTLLRHTFPSWRQVVLDEIVDVSSARDDPDLFLDNHPPPLVIDEIQFAPQLLNAIKRRVDRDRSPGQYIVTGSQQWAVIRSASESLAGRAVFFDLEGFSLSESVGAPRQEHWLARYLAAPEDFVQGLDPGASRIQLGRTLFERLWRGALPEADGLELDWVATYHRGYIRSYLERDVRLVADVGDWNQFSRFVRLAAALTAQEVNRSQFGRDVGVTPHTADRWLSILRATFQWYEAPPFHGNATKRISGRPKGYFADTGTVCALQSISSPQALSGHPLARALFETAVCGEIRKLSTTLTTPSTIHHWRTHGGAEVDLLLERDGWLHPIEVKLASRPGRGDARGIAALRATYSDRRIAPGLVIAPLSQDDGPRRIADGAWTIPWDLE